MDSEKQNINISIIGDNNNLAGPKEYTPEKGHVFSCGNCRCKVHSDLQWAINQIKIKDAIIKKLINK